MSGDDTADVSNLDQFESNNSSKGMVKAYCKLPPSDKQWLENKSDELGISESEMFRRLVFQARIKDKDGQLVGF